MGGKKKNSILIVDDERDNISILKNILCQEYTIYASTSGNDAIETAQSFMPDVILLDILMPDMDGYDVITAIKNSDKTRDIPVIFISGLDNINAEIKGLALGATDYILKPFNPAIVKLRIKNCIQVVERLRQQALMTKIAHNFLINAHTSELYDNTLRMVAEFMGITTLLLYELEKNNNTLKCKNEWLDPKSELKSRIGDKLELDETVISTINNSLTGDEKDICVQSKDPMAEKIKMHMQHLDNYIATPTYIECKMCGILVFSSSDNNREWGESEIDLAVLVSSIFSGAYERDAIQQAEHLSRAKSEFLSRMSHEMRTPLNAIMGILQLFGITGVPDNMKEHCKTMNKSAHDLLRLIDDVLDVANMESGIFKLYDSAFDFKKVVWEILREADNNAAKKQQILDCKMDPAIPSSLIGDEKRIKQVIATILNNAIKFTRESGEIFFDARVINDDNGIITIQIDVRDNGIGISKEQQNALFSVFEQADGGLSREYGGIGTGLALSKHIIEIMGGNIQVESELGKGSKFSFTFILKKNK